MTTPAASEAIRPQPDAGQLAVDRTRLAYERTLLAWIRTATGLITFGFSIYKFFELQHAALGTIPGQHHILSARGFAIMAMAMGLAALVLSSIEYAGNIRTMRAQSGHVPRSFAGIFAVMISIFGLLGLCEALFLH
jgi:putative membrane protein